MLTGLAFAAFQVDVDAQSRRGGESRSTNTSRSSGSASRSSNTSRSSNVTRSSGSSSSSSVSSSSRSSSRQSAVRPSVSNQSSNRGTASRSGSSRTVSPSSSVKPSSSNKTSVQTRPASPSRQVRPSGSSDVKRPQSGAVVDSKPSNTVRRPSDRMDANRPGYRPGDRKPASSPVVRDRPVQHPRPGTAYKPGHGKPPVKVYPNHRHDKPRVHPIHRDFIAYNKPCRYWDRHYHYFGHRVRVLPARAIHHRYRGISYYCYNDIWYRPYGGYYVISRPPFGTVLAANIISDMAWAAVRISYYNTVFNTYSTINDNNRYIAEQNEIIARNNATIAAQNNAIAMNQAQANVAYQLANDLGLVQSYAAANSEYFYQDGVFYAKASNGEYSVIVPPAGALVESLPEDYDMVTLKGNEYYKVDDTVFKVTLSEGKPYFEVLGQLYS